MVKPLAFKGDKKSKKRKRQVEITDKHVDAEAGPLGATLSKPNIETTGDDDDSWVTAEESGDLIGPVIIILPSETPTCITCDTSGKVFTTLLENIVDGDPCTAEPHDVRQVWVANRIAGTENFTFKGHHGK